MDINIIINSILYRQNPFATFQEGLKEQKGVNDHKRKYKRIVDKTKINIIDYKSDQRESKKKIIPETEVKLSKPLKINVEEIEPNIQDFTKTRFKLYSKKIEKSINNF